MKPISEFDQVNVSVAVWHGYDPSVKTNLSATALRLANGWVFIDPLPLEKSALIELLDDAPLTAILLTNANHERAADDLRFHFKASVYAHRDAESELEIRVDHWLADGDRLFDKLQVIALPGAANGEVAFFAELEKRTLVIGDALIHLNDSGFDLLPQKYCNDQKQLRESLQKLLQFPAEILTFAHGLPIIAKAAKRLQSLIQS